MAKLLEALKGSNAQSGGASMEVDDGDVGKLGYTKPGYPTAGAALANSDISGTKESVGSMGNDGTSRKSYKIQPETVSAKNPEPGSKGTGNAGA